MHIEVTLLKAIAEDEKVIKEYKETIRNMELHIHYLTDRIKSHNDLFLELAGKK